MIGKTELEMLWEHRAILVLLCYIILRIHRINFSVIFKNGRAPIPIAIEEAAEEYQERK
jgi:hypothetical protein